MLELDNENKVTQILDLNNQQTETAQTIFYNGIISSSIISLEKRLNTEQIFLISEEYNYINLLTDFVHPDLSLNKKKLILDASTEDPQTFSFALRTNYEKLKQFGIYEIISASTYIPALIAGIKTEINILSITKPILWQNCNLTNKLLTINTKLTSV
jgi:hypothetical protein